MAKRDTRQHILEKGADLIYSKGFNHTGIQEILDVAQVPKGSFYYYFKSKEVFGVALVDYFFDFFESKLKYCLVDKKDPPLEKLMRFFDLLIMQHEDRGCIGGSAIGNLGQEMSDLSERFRCKIENCFIRFEKYIVILLKEAVLLGQIEIDPAMSIEEISGFIVNSWEGSLLRMKTKKNLSSVRLFQKILFQKLL
jgi:TetR/AcrR family transcriptional regulator, transcriptional repressor for nem operon